MDTKENAARKEYFSGKVEINESLTALASTTLKTQLTARLADRGNEP